MTAQLDLFKEARVASFGLPKPSEAAPCGDRQQPENETVPSAFFDAKAQPSISCYELGTHGRIRKPFSHRGALWIATSGRYQGEVQSVECYRVVQASPDAATYSEWDWSAQRGHAMGAYHKMRVKQGGRDLMLEGPPLTLTRAVPALQ